MSPETRREEKTAVVLGQINVKHPPPPPAVNAFDDFDDVTQRTCRSFILNSGDNTGEHYLTMILFSSFWTIMWWVGTNLITVMLFGMCDVVLL
jgi:hypothetical protein